MGQFTWNNLQSNVSCKNRCLNSQHYLFLTNICPYSILFSFSGHFRLHVDLDPDLHRIRPLPGHRPPASPAHAPQIGHRPLSLLQPVGHDLHLSLRVLHECWGGAHRSQSQRNGHQDGHEVFGVVGGIDQDILWSIHQCHAVCGTIFDYFCVL